MIFWELLPVIGGIFGRSFGRGNVVRVGGIG